MAGLTNPLTEIKTPDYKNITFIGTVIDNDDPEKLERVRVRIPEMYERVEDGDLPWAVPIAMRKLGATGSVGEFGNIPEVGSIVYVELQNGDLHFPVLRGSVLDINTRLPEAGPGYPNVYGWVDRAGNVFFVDTNSGQVTIRVTHTSGSEFLIEDDGKITITGKADLEVVIDGAANVNVQGDVNITAPNAIVTADTIDLGGGATEPLVLGNAFMTFLNNYLSAEYQLHTHPTGVGPSGPPVAPATPMSQTELSPQNTTL